METAKKFTNFSTKDFSHKYDGKVWNFPAGESILLQTELVEHFAKHLIDRELNKLEEKTNNKVLREEMMIKCVGKEVVEAESSEKLSTKIINQKKEEPKEAPVEKETPKEEEKVEKEFEDLDEAPKEEIKEEIKVEAGPAEVATDKVSTPKVEVDTNKEKVEVKKTTTKKKEDKK